MQFRSLQWLVGKFPLLVVYYNTWLANALRIYTHYLPLTTDTSQLCLLSNPTHVLPIITATVAVIHLTAHLVG